MLCWCVDELVRFDRRAKGLQDCRLVPRRRAATAATASSSSG